MRTFSYKTAFLQIAYSRLVLICLERGWTESAEKAGGKEEEKKRMNDGRPRINGMRNPSSMV